MPKHNFLLIYCKNAPSYAVWDRSYKIIIQITPTNIGSVHFNLGHYRSVLGSSNYVVMLKHYNKMMQQ
jgi:hypothetical protein